MTATDLDARIGKAMTAITAKLGGQRSLLIRRGDGIWKVSVSDGGLGHDVVIRNASLIEALDRVNDNLREER